MSDSAKPENQSQDDSVSLIDLLVVLLRFRFWILGITGTGVLLSALYFWVLPRFEPVKVSTGSGYITQLTVGIVNPPSLLAPFFDSETTKLIQAPFFDTNLAKLTQAWFQNLSLVTPVYRDLVVKNNQQFDPSQFDAKGSLESYLQNNVLDKTLKVKDDVPTVSMKVTMEDLDAERAKAFLKALSEKVKQQVTAEAQKRLQAARQALVEASASMNAGTGGPQERTLAVSDFLQKQFLLDQLTKDSDFPYQQQGDIVVLEQVAGKGIMNMKVSPSLSVLLASGGSLVASIVLAFLLEYLRRVRGNSEDMLKLRQVLEKPAKSR